jgi:hypothetical protein
LAKHSAIFALANTKVFFLHLNTSHVMKTIGTFKPTQINYKGISIVVLLFLFSNALTYRLGVGINEELNNRAQKSPNNQLYLLDKAQAYVYDVKGFEKKVKEVSNRLSIPAEWLMAVIYAESRFDASAQNHKGSGAVGLIQFMPATLREMNLTTQHLQNMNHTEQLDFTYQYLNKVQHDRQAFKSLTDVYLGILYPDAIGEDPCYTLYSRPEINYQQNSGLDEDKDGKVTVSDIDRFLRRIYPTAYNISKTQSWW